MIALGTYVEKALSAVGITEKKVSAAIGRPCNCKKRRDAMNAFGFAAQTKLGRAVSAVATQFLMIQMRIAHGRFGKAFHYFKIAVRIMFFGCK